MSNTHPTTGVRYGVISCNSLDQGLVQDLMYGEKAVDLDYKAAYDEAEKEAKREADAIDEAAMQALTEHLGETIATIDKATLAEMCEAEAEAIWLHKGYEDRDDYVNQKLEQFSDCWSCDEPTIEGEYEGVKYRISWLGGAPLLWVIEGPTGYASSLCSPCVPGAADLDSGITWGQSLPAGSQPDRDCYLCYVVPRDWLSELEKSPTA